MFLYVVIDYFSYGQYARVLKEKRNDNFIAELRRNRLSEQAQFLQPVKPN